MKNIMLASRETERTLISLRGQRLQISASGKARLEVKDLNDNALAVVFVDHSTAQTFPLTGDFMVRIENRDLCAQSVYFHIEELA